MNNDLTRLTDVELSELFAIEVLGYVRYESLLTGKASFYVDERRHRYENHPPTVQPKELQFATNANSVMPYLMEKIWMAGTEATFEDGSEYSNGVAIKFKMVGIEPVIAPTFARAACIALINAARENKKNEST